MPRPTDPVLCRVDRRRADLLGDRDPLRPRRGPGRGDRGPARPAAAAVRAGRRARHRARRHRHPSLVGLPRAAHHRHRALPPRGGGAQVRGLAQQHVLAARPRGHPRRRPGRAGVRPAAARAARCCWRSRPTRRSWTGATPGLHSARTQIFTKSFPRCGVPDAFGSWDAFAQYVEFLVRTAVDRRVHPGVVVDPAALLVRHGRGADLRRPDHGGGVGGAGGADRGLRGPGGPGRR